jgi:hypothetical protein
MKIHRSAQGPFQRSWMIMVQVEGPVNFSEGMETGLTCLIQRATKRRLTEPLRCGAVEGDPDG